MNRLLKSTLAVAGVLMAMQTQAQVTFYEHPNFEGKSFTAQGRVGDFQRQGFNDRASSIVVVQDRWEICEHAGFGGQCIVLSQGRYASIMSMGLNDKVSSARMVDVIARADTPVQASVPDDRYRRDGDERLYQADVTAVHAVVGPPEQRCWLEPAQVVQAPSGANIPGALLGAVLGGVLGHQVGGGRGKDLATAGGAVAGAAVGANVGRIGERTQASGEGVQRCTTVPGKSQNDYWDVTYTFRGVEHRMQTTSPPGQTVNVNWQGEPRT